MKIVGTDNFNREEVSDFLVADNIESEEFAKVMCDALNAKFCKYDDSPTYYEVRGQARRLQTHKWEP